MPKNPEAIEKFTRAIYKAQKWVETHSSKEIAESIKSFFPDIETDILTASIDRYKAQGSFASDPILDEKEWNNLQNIMDEAGELPKRVAYKTLVNTDFATKVTK